MFFERLPEQAFVFCCGVQACLGFAQIRADTVLIGAQEKLALSKGEELISLVLRVSPWCRNADFCVGSRKQACTGRLL